jgi:protein-serine/threonine kinase
MDPLADILTPPGSLPEERHFDALPTFHDSPEYASLVKNKSTSNLLQARGLSAIDTAKRMSFDAGQLDRMAR